MSYVVVYGETMPAWEQRFSTKRATEAFIKKHESFGDVIFSVEKINVNDKRPRGIIAKIQEKEAHK